MHIHHGFPVARMAAAIAAVVLIAAPSDLTAQVTESSTSGRLFTELVRMDSILFDIAFVSCDADRFRCLFTSDAEFYHDKVPPAYDADVSTLEGCPKDGGVRRVLVPGSLRVYPIAEFGAIQMGEHRFLEADSETGTIAKFVHLWSDRDGEWRIARVLSFDHLPEQEP